jgi:hypothetical protein
MQRSAHSPKSERHGAVRTKWREDMKTELEMSNAKATFYFVVAGLVIAAACANFFWLVNAFVS